MIFDGFNGGTVELLDEVLVIKRQGLRSALNHGLKGEKRIPYGSITSVQFKEPGMTTGYIQFGVTGGAESRGGVMAATQDENTVLFTAKATDDFRKLRDIVERRSLDAKHGRPAASTPVAAVNVAEELGRLADLRDRGILSEEEFAEQKRRVLGAGPAARTETRDEPLSEFPREFVRPTQQGTNAPVERSGKSTGQKVGIGCAVVLGIFILLSILGSIVGDGKSGNADPAASEAPSTAAPLAVTAVEVARAYSANEAAAQSAYGDKPLLVTGTVAGISLDLIDKPVVQLATDNQFMPANANLVEADEGKAKTLRKGTQITLLCENVSEVIGMPQFADCAIR